MKSAKQAFTELEGGIYYLDYNFTIEGTYIGLFFENTKATTVGIFRVISSLETIKENVVKLLQVQKGRWKIINNQLIIYDADNTTELYKFNLYDGTGTPSEKDVCERVPVQP